MPTVAESTAECNKPLNKRDWISNAERFIADRYGHPDHSRLVYSAETWYAWNGRSYDELEPDGVRAAITAWLKRLPEEEREGIILDRSALKEVFECAKSSEIIYTKHRPPCWLTESYPDRPNADHLLIGRNGMLDLTDPDGPLLINTPGLFSVNSVACDIDQRRPQPTHWLAFLESLWPGDAESKALLAEWMGYCLTPDTSQQKILFMLGPPRSGKGTIGRVLKQLTGSGYVAPTLASLGTNFGLEPLIDKRVGFISDARLSGRSDLAIVTERLLSISGEDVLTIDRKNRSAVSTKLPTRFMICTNEVPRLPDSSGALPGRFLVLNTTRSFLGNEDRTLLDRLLSELPGILMWAVDGYSRLSERGKFAQPASGQQVIAELKDIASPVAQFVAEWCVLPRPDPYNAGRLTPDPVTLWVTRDDLYAAWVEWSKSQGLRHTAKPTFGRDLRAVLFSLTSVRRRVGPDAKQVYVYEGIALTMEAQLEVGRRSSRSDAAAAPDAGQCGGERPPDRDDDHCPV